jgi:hypothetical protein
VGVRPIGTLPNPSQCLGALQPPHLRLRYEVAPLLGFAKNAISLDRLSESCQQALLRFTFSQLNKHKDILSGHRLVLSSRYPILLGSAGYARPLPAATCRRVLGEALPTVHRTVISGLERNLSLLSTIGADYRVHLTGAIPAATVAASGPARCPAGRAPLGLVGEATAGMVLLVLGRERELGSALDASQCSVCIGHSTTSLGLCCSKSSSARRNGEYSLQFEDEEDFLRPYHNILSSLTPPRLAIGSTLFAVDTGKGT